MDFENLKRSLGESVEAGIERYGMNWAGKSDCFRIIQQPSVGSLKPVRGESVNFDETENLFIEGDNLEVLKLLQKSYYGKIKMIYIDPPYNTGNDFIYPDNYTENLDTYLKYTGQVDDEGRKYSTNTEAEGRFHTKWINMMYPRLYLARNLLRDDGAIVISIDDGEISNLIKICDEIYGEENFKADISWQKRYTRSNNTIDFTTVVEHVIVYAKSGLFNVNLLERTQEADSRYSNPDNDKKGPWKGASFLNPATPEQRPNLCYPIINPNTDDVTYPTTNAWRRSKAEYNKLLSENRLYWGIDGTQNVPSIKMYLSEARNLTPINFWGHEYAGNTDDGTKELNNLMGTKVFDNPKPSLLVKRVLEHVSNSESIILDFFSGSGTTAHAILDLNRQDGGKRKFILVQLPEICTEGSEAFKAGFSTIADISKERIRRVINKIEEEIEGKLDYAGKVLDLGFKVYKLDKSNFKIWDAADLSDPDELSKQLELHVDHVDPDSEQEDILYELLLKSGFELTTKVEKIELADKDVFSIADGMLLICLEAELTKEVIRAMADKEPARVICLDTGFKNNDQLKTNAVQIMKSKGIEDFLTV